MQSTHSGELPSVTLQTHLSPALAAAFDLKGFTDALQVASEKLHELLARQDVAGVVLEPPQALVAEARALMSANADEPFDVHRFGQILDLYIRTGIRVNSTGYMARQFSSVIPISAVFDLVSAMAPQPASYYEAGQLANVADKIMAEEFGKLLGWQSGEFDMVTTSGASLANLTAVLAARNHHLGDSWQQGVGITSRGRPAIAIGSDAHFSVSRLAGIIGIGQDQVVRLPLNARRQICASQAASVLDQAKARGLDVFCIVASAGSTAIGAIDPLEELAILARARGAWLHVDAAHNGAFLVSDHLRPRLRGLEMADSFCLDAHKTLFVPALCTLLFYRSTGLAEAVFPVPASYVAEPSEEEMNRFQSGMKNFECTKRPAILNLWLVWALFGRSVFEEKLDHLVELTQSTKVYLDGLPDFEVMHQPESNILCFVHRPANWSGPGLNRLQVALRDSIRAEGRHLISMVDLDGTTVLRLVLMNHCILISDVIELVHAIRRHTKLILTEWDKVEALAGSEDNNMPPQMEIER